MVLQFTGNRKESIGKESLEICPTSRLSEGAGLDFNNSNFPGLQRVFLANGQVVVGNLNAVNIVSQPTTSFNDMAVSLSCLYSGPQFRD